MRNPIRGDHGFSLMEAMIAMGVGSVVLLGLASQMDMVGRAGRNTSVNSNWSLLGTTVANVINSEDTCTFMFTEGESVQFKTSGDSIKKLQLKSGVVAEVDPKGNADGIAISGMKYDLYSPKGMAVTELSTGLPHTAYTAHFDIDGTKANFKNVKLGSETLATRSIPFTIVTDATGKIKGCYGQMSARFSPAIPPKALCLGIGYTWNEAENICDPCPSLTARTSEWDSSTGQCSLSKKFTRAPTLAIGRTPSSTLTYNGPDTNVGQSPGVNIGQVDLNESIPGNPSHYDTIHNPAGNAMNQSMGQTLNQGMNQGLNGGALGGANVGGMNAGM